MTDQPSLFGEPEPEPEPDGRARMDDARRAAGVDADWPGLVGRDHPGTSHAAALSVLPRTGTQRRRVLDAIAARPAMDEELQHGLGLGGNTERPRRVELLNGGWIEDSGERRRTTGGLDAIVWQITTTGLAALHADDPTPCPTCGATRTVDGPEFGAFTRCPDCAVGTVRPWQPASATIGP